MVEIAGISEGLGIRSKVGIPSHIRGGVVRAVLVVVVGSIGGEISRCGSGSYNILNWGHD